MKRIKTYALTFVTLLCPVVLAACYGPPRKEAFLTTGAVLDGKTMRGITGIHVTCLVGPDIIGDATSEPDGVFTVHSEVPCQSLKFQDPDREENGGPYREMEVKINSLETDMTFELETIAK